jgi:Flp pilus assembly protein TadG
MTVERERGSLTVEAVVLAPVLVLVLLAAVFVHRYTEASFRLTRVADVAARTASQVQFDSMSSHGAMAARRELAATYPSCSGASVRLSTRTEAGLLHVTATVRCNVDMGGLTLLGVGRRTVTATSTEVVDFHTNRGA